MRFIKKYGYGFFLGGALGILGFHVMTWEFWIIMIFVVFLAEWKVFGVTEG